VQSLRDDRRQVVGGWTTNSLTFYSSKGDVYARVINDVCDASRQDFEEGGVELATLDLLKSVGGPLLQFQCLLSSFHHQNCMYVMASTFE
jgi:hypothetical protein